ncbi:adhesion G protein-coupled receptor E1 isoform X6 [Ailuropoda melanoleuca]|uniref:adhesion G protein-coupled receptor E1 isoform X6 n=1 Tax=Ailuropoda melanoleuca TaxID=9646 RepID=UPI001493E483|nr:adhesion G protein-coupled receptor E1 isoform X6 [Ailuropoda melanoleuca]
MWSFNLLLFWDENECLDTTTCPAYATCTNTLESYYCTCKRGFLSSNGLTHFRGPGVACEDIDECSQNPPPCGPHSVCRNLLGRYKCSCVPGFSSPTGNDWVLGMPGRFSCTDINECLSTGVCPEHAECINSLGSYSCSCQVGFISHNSVCKDVDECADPGICPEHATCRNSPGSYSCVCNPGFESSSGNTNIQGPGETCEDVDECARNSTLCGLSSVCINILGRYNCSCLPGFFSPAVWTPEKPEDFRCVDIDECLHMCPSNATCTNTPGSYFCTCSPGFAPSNGQLSFTGQEVECRDVDECSQDPSPCGPNSVCTNVLGSYGCSCPGGFEPNPEGSLNFSCKRIPFKCKEDVIPNNEWVQLCQVGGAVEPEYGSFCALLNTTFGVLDDACGNRTATVSLKNTVESFASVLEQTSTWSNFTKEETSALATVVLESVKSTTLAAFLKPSANASQTVRTERLEIESKIIKEECTEENVTFHFKAKGDTMEIGCSTIEESESRGTIGVAFASFSGMESLLDDSFFQDHGTPSANSQRKLKSRVVQGIMTGAKKAGFSEPVIYTLENTEPKQEFERPICVSWDTDAEGGRWMPSGCVVLEASETHTVCSCYQMVNLAIIMASRELTMGCAIIAGFLHYLFLACFFWMLVEAVMLFLMVRNLKVVNYFSSRNIKMWYLCAFGYGLPVLVVAVSASVQPKGYGMHNRCWLNLEAGFIWSFLGPVCTIITINSILLTWTLCVLRQKLSSVNAEVSTLKDTRLLTFKAFAQLFILGCSWVLGVFQIGPIASIMAYLFTIINSLQGTFIFVIHCLLNRQVREEYRRWITRKIKPSSESQTSGMLLSSVPSTSKTA